MRTKTLLLTAALGAAGIATSMAQVYSVNAVGYVNTPLVPGFSLVSNPLDNQSGNTVANLFGNGIQGTIPAGMTIYWFENGNFDFVQYDDLDEAFIPAAKADKVIEPGNGVFVRNPTQQTVTVTFVGDVPQGNLSNPIPQGFSIKASMVPQAGTATELGLGTAGLVPGDTIYMFNEETQNYLTPSTFDDLDNAFVPPLQPLEVGEAFFIRKVQAGTWTRQFDVNAE